MSRPAEARTVHEAAADAAERGLTLMVQSLTPPRYAVPYPAFIEEIRERGGAIPEQAEQTLASLQRYSGENALKGATGVD